MHEFSIIQDIVQSLHHRVLKLSQSRSLSRGQVIERIIEQWDALEFLFQSQSHEVRVDGAGQIFYRMKTLGTKHMLLFLNYYFAKVDKLNVQFQSRNFCLHKLYRSICDECILILGMFIKDRVIENYPLHKIDPCNEIFQKPIQDIQLGGRCNAIILQNPLADNEERFRKDCLKFLMNLCTQIKKRFPSVIEEERLDDLEEEWRALLLCKNSLTDIYIESPTVF